MEKITRVGDLIYHHNQKHPNSHFFDPETLKYFGETRSTMRLLKGTVKIKTYSGDEHTCYMLSSLQRKAPNGPKRVYHYFDVETLAHVIRPES